jgi:conjugative relaxase-like TrwC/TraI family protein
MIRVYPSASAAQAKRYFVTGLRHGDYYLAASEEPGRWYGRGAERLGLSGEVTQEAFYALLDNQRPDGSGDTLTVRDKGEARRCGTDIVFSVPKSVSALRALTGDDRIRVATMGSAKETLDEIERDAIATRLRRGGQGGTVKTGNAVFALFPHDTTRELDDGRPDPHDHIHAYLLNATYAPHESRWQAIDAFDLHIDRPYFEAAFEARLAGKLAALGYGIERHAGGWGIAGLPRSISDKLSRRTAEIEAEAERRGITDPKRKAELGAKTRRRKSEPLPPEELRSYWLAKLTPEERAAITAAHSGATGGAAVTPTRTAAGAVDHAIDHLFSRDSTVGVRQIEAEALRFGVGAVSPETIREEVRKRNLTTATQAGRETATTAEAIAQERSLLRFAQHGRGTCDPLAGYGAPPAISREYLSDSQKAAVRHVLGSFDRVQILRGKAGVGKSTVLAEVRDAVQARGGQVLAVAPTTGAVEVLAKDGFQAETVARLLVDERLHKSLRGGVLVVDEAGLVGVPTMHKLFQLAERQDARIILAGDSLQHRSVERGAALRLLEQRAGLKPATLDQIIRQTHAPFREAVAALARGDGEGGFAKLEGLGAVVEITDAETRYHTLAREYADALARQEEVLAIAPTHAEGASVTAAIRQELRSRNLLGSAERSLTRLENLQLTDAQKRDAASYAPGQVIAFTQNAKGGWQRGERVTVTGWDAASVRVKTQAGEEKHIPLALADKFQVFHARELPVAKGDRLRFTQNQYQGKKRLAANGAVATVTGFTRNGVVLDNGMTLDARQAQHVAPGWAVTSVASQGKTVKGTVFIAQSRQSLPASSLEQLYVSASRSRERVRLFTDDAESLRRAVATPERSASAIELVEAAAHEKKPAVRRRRHAELLNRLKYFADAAAHRLRQFGQIDLGRWQPPAAHTPMEFQR